VRILAASVGGVHRAVGLERYATLRGQAYPQVQLERQ
jgi:hypothetical protein